MKRIALMGLAYSGKTTLAKELQRRGYMLANFTDVLKFELATALQAVGKEVTMQDIKRDKATYRPLLQEFGKVIGFNDKPDYVIFSLGEWFDSGESVPVVFDNVRTVAQWEVLKPYGFSLVEVVTPESVRLHRAYQAGVLAEEYGRLVAHPVETEAWTGLRNIAYTLDGTKPIEQLADEVMSVMTFSI